MNIRASIILLLLFSIATHAVAGPERWEKDIRKFEQQDTEQSFPKGGILFVGSSSIRMWKTLEEDFPKHQILNRGFGGSQVEDSLHFAEQLILKHAPKQVVLYAGDNDIAKEKTAERVFADYIRLIDTIQESHPKCHVTFIAIKPSLKRWNLSEEMFRANQLVNRFSETDERLSYADIWTPTLTKEGTPMKDIFMEDGLHLNAKGYAIWREVIAPLLKD